MFKSFALLSPLLLTACQAPLPKAVPIAGNNGLQRVLVETFGLE